MKSEYRKYEKKSKNNFFSNITRDSSRDQINIQLEEKYQYCRKIM